MALTLRKAFSTDAMGPKKALTHGDLNTKEKANQNILCTQWDIFIVQMHMQLCICSLVLDFTVSYETEQCPSFKGFMQDPILGVDQCDNLRQLK